MRHNFDEIINRRVSECKKYEAACYPRTCSRCGSRIRTLPYRQKFPRPSSSGQSTPASAIPLSPLSLKRRQRAGERVRFGWNVDPHWVKYANGVLPFLMYAIRAYSYPGDKVVIQPPVYPPFSAIVRNNGRQLLENRLVQDETANIKLILTIWRKLKDPRTKLFFMSNPTAPLCAASPLKSWKRIGELCLKYNVLVISDEIHCDRLIKVTSTFPLVPSAGSLQTTASS